MSEDAFADVRSKDEEKPLPTLSAPIQTQMAQTPFGVPMTFEQQPNTTFAPPPQATQQSSAFPPFQQQGGQQPQQFFGQQPAQQTQGFNNSFSQPTFSQPAAFPQSGFQAAPIQSSTASSDFGDFGDFGSFDAGHDATSFDNFQQAPAAIPAQQPVAFNNQQPASSTPSFAGSAFSFDAPAAPVESKPSQQPTPKKDFTPVFALELDSPSAFTAVQPTPAPVQVAVPASAPTKDFTPSFVRDLGASPAPSSQPAAPAKKDFAPAFSFELEPQPATPVKKDFMPAFMSDLVSSNPPATIPTQPHVPVAIAPVAIAPATSDFGDFGDFSAAGDFPAVAMTTTSTIGFPASSALALTSTPVVPTSNSPLDSNTRIDKAGAMKAFHLEITSPQLKHAVPPADKYSFFAELREEVGISDPYLSLLLQETN